MEAIRVVVRVRPREEQHSVLVPSNKRGVNKSITVLPDPSKLPDDAKFGQKSARLTVAISSGTYEGQEFRFDQVFGPESTQEELYQTVSPLVDAAVNGFMSTVFAYGPTGSGKTYTVSGIPGQPGIIPRAVTQMFERINEAASSSQSLAFMVFLSYTEVYNEAFYDLLSPTFDASHRVPSYKIQLRDSHQRGVYLTGSPTLRTPVTSAQQVLSLIAKGNVQRATGATNLNERSSRSHAILTLDIECQDSNRGGGMSRMGRINLIDLAGSERVGLSGVEGERMTETQT